MTTGEFYTYQKQLFDAFSKRIIKNLGVNIFHELVSRSETTFFVGEERVVVIDSRL